MKKIHGTNWSFNTFINSAVIFFYLLQKRKNQRKYRRIKQTTLNTKKQETSKQNKMQNKLQKGSNDCSKIFQRYLI